MARESCHLLIFKIKPCEEGDVADFVQGELQ